MGGRTLKRRWRLIVSPPADGPGNMALDEALSDSVRQGGLPFVRFYTWMPGTLSLGRFQNLDTGLGPESRLVPRVRRLTGGGGIWHADELTYSLGCLQDDVGVTGVKPSFERLCGFLLDAWHRLGWDASFAKDAAAEGPLGGFSPACFAGQEEYDILVNGKKLGGNAQKRDRASIFQHGSIPRLLDRPMLDRLFEPGFRPLASSTTDLVSCGWSDTSALIPRLAASFQSVLETDLVDSQPSEAEESQARSLVERRYGTPTWTEFGSGNLRSSSAG